MDVENSVWQVRYKLGISSDAKYATSRRSAVVHGLTKERSAPRCGSTSWWRWAQVLVACSGMLMVAATAAAEEAAFPPSETIFPATTKAWISIPDSRGFGDAFNR